MNYPPSYTGQYPPQYPQQCPLQQHLPPQQLLYSNANPAPPPSSLSPYQYGKPLVHPQSMIPPYLGYAPPYSQPQQRQHEHQPKPQLQPQPRVQSQPQPQPPQPQPHLHPQYVNPADLFQQTPLPTPPRPHFHGSSQLDGQPPAPDSRPLAPTTTSLAKSQPLSCTAPNQNQSTTISQPPQPVSNSPQQQQQQPTPVAPSPSRPVPQVIVPTPSPEAQRKMQQQVAKVEIPKETPKKETKRRPKQPPANKPPKPSKPSKPPIDYQILLLSLADEYLNAAQKCGTMVAFQGRETGLEEYYKLVATGLGCLEAVLKNWRLQPRMEALVRLRYARILFEETDNNLEAETALSKGIDLCERNRMLDLKYSMQHLMARMLHRTNPKASLKAVDNMIQDVEAYRHSAWEYAFRFLRVSLSLSSSTHQDTVSALHHLQKISAMANRNGDKAVAAMSAVIEALAQLQQGTSFDAIEQAQRAVAVARSHQLNDDLRHVSQLTSLIQMVDICCSVLEYDVNQSSQKLKVMQGLIDETLSDPNWCSDGSFSIPLSGKSAGPSSIDTGDILQVKNGTLLLSFSWLPQHDLYGLCYFLSSVTLSAKNSKDGGKAEKFLNEGRRLIKGSLVNAPQEITESMVNASRRFEWRRTLYCNLLLQQVFLTCARSDWDLARQTLKELREVAEELGDSLPDTTSCLMEYAAGVIAQATGDLKGALAIFQTLTPSLTSSVSKTARNDPCRDSAILAAINTALILRDPAHPSHSNLAGVMSTIESFCKSSPNKYIQSAYYMICATVQTGSNIQTKQFLQQALQSAAAINNSQITCIALTFMSWKYFRGVVGEQAEKSARAGHAMARKASDHLWISVADEMLAESLEKQGKEEEAGHVREEGHRVVMGLPPGLRRAG